jgi:hypothetical protein
MLAKIVLDYESNPEVVDRETLLKYEGQKDLEALSSLEAVADTRELSLTWLGDLFPNLEKLRLNNSIIPSVRDISNRLVRLRFLSLAQCGITSLDGIATISTALEELYLAFNRITDLSELIGLPKLKVLDLEENCVASTVDAKFLRCCPALRALTLARNPAAQTPNYREEILEAVPQLVYLDEKRLKPKEAKVVVVAEPLEIVKIEKRPRGREKARSVDRLRGDPVVTELMEAAINDRPPSSRAYCGGAGFTVRPPIEKNASPRLVRPISGRVVRPRSAYQPTE